MLRQKTKELNNNKLINKEIMTLEVNKHEIVKPKMLRKISGFILLLIIFVLLFPTKTLAAIKPIYNNDFEKMKQTRYTDKVHGNAFYQEKTITLDKHYDTMTIAFFINPLEYLHNESKLINIKDKDGEDEIYVSISDESNPKWVVNVGDAIVKSDNIALLDNWTFIAIVFDKNNNQMRVIINDKVYYKNTKIETLSKKINISMFDCNWIDNLNVYDDILTLEELETLKSSSIEKDSGYYKIYDKSEYINPLLTRGKSLSNELKDENGDLHYKVTSSALFLERTIDSAGEYIVEFKRGDIVKVKKINLTKNKVLVETLNGKKGYLNINNFIHDLIQTDTNVSSELYFTYLNFGNADNKGLEVKIVYVLSIILLFGLTYIFRKLISKNHINVKGLFTPSIYAFAIYMISLFFMKDYEFYWFIHGGWKTIPYGYTELYDWILLGALSLFIVIHAVKVISTISKYGVLNGIISYTGIFICNILSFFIMIFSKNILKNHEMDIIFISLIILFVAYIVQNNKACFITVWSNDTSKHPLFQFKGKIKKDNQNVGKNAKHTKNSKETEDRNNTGKNNSNNDINSNKTDNKSQNTSNNNNTSNSSTSNSNTSDSNTNSTNNTNYSKNSNYYYHNSGTNNNSTNNNNTNHNNTNYSNSNSKQNSSNANQNNNSYHASSNERKLNYFGGVTTQEELRTRYKSLLKMYHPDNQCGDNDITQEINSEYEYVRNKIKN